MKIHQKNHQTQDLVTSTAPLYYVSKLIGLVNWDSSGDASTRTLIKGRFYIPYHISYFFIHVILISGSFYFRLKTHTQYQYDPKIVLFNIYTSLFISIVVIVCHHIFRNSFRKTLNNLIELDKQFVAFGLNTNHNSVFKGCLGLTGFLLMTAVWFTVTTIMSTKLYDFYYYLLFFFQYLVTMTMKTQFCSYNVVIKYRFKILDEKLREVIESSNNLVTNNKIIFVKSAEKETSDQMIYSPAYKILTLSEFHSKLYNIAKRINLFYSVQILLIIGKYFVEVTATLYYNLQKFYRKNQHYDIPTFFMLIWAIMNALDLLILVFACDSMCCTANSSKITLHRLNLNSKDTELKREVTAFSLQLLHNELVLSAAGFFNLDFTLIFNIIGAVTTYLVIFVQFDMGDQDKMSNSTLVNSTGLLNSTGLNMTGFNVTGLNMTVGT